ncbi:MAG: penicillin acylase family protein, partial [Pseudomonadota bacterium]
QYLTPDGWAPFATRQIRIETGGGAALVETVRYTSHGPVLSGEQFNAHKVVPEGHVASLAWTALVEADTTMTSLHRLMTARDIDAAAEAASLAIAPAQNVILADSTGVGMVAAGALPRRSPESRSQGQIPALGWLPENGWLGTLPATQNPRILRPVEGAVANANNRITDGSFPNHITFDWSYPYRINRLQQELSARAFHSRDSFIALQTDTVSEMARSVLPLIARELWWRADPTRSEQMRSAIELMRGWNGEMNRFNPEPLIFAAWVNALTRKLTLDELGPTLFAEIEGPRPLFIERVFRNIEGAAIWCDIDKTPEAETCADIAEAALEEALRQLTDAHGPQIESWRWGEEHVAIHRHQPLGRAGPLGAIVNIRQETSGGNFTLMRGLSAGRGSAPHENVHAAGFRVVLDFADLDRSVWMISTGQSGHPFSRWYDHLAEPWARGDVIPMSRDDEAARAGAVGVLEIVPSP